MLLQDNHEGGVRQSKEKKHRSTGCLGWVGFVCTNVTVQFLAWKCL